MPWPVKLHFGLEDLFLMERWEAIGVGAAACFEPSEDVEVISSENSDVNESSGETALVDEPQAPMEPTTNASRDYTKISRERAARTSSFLT
mmetsp:Transcript_157173/g.504251  ORF Transcript_157173/g.504251 Transcript_157173/m.504251 type:complete len:91 (-) Transcript_157173:2-274(-)